MRLGLRREDSFDRMRMPVEARSDTSRSAVYAPFIDGLRAIAVVAVVIYHLNSAWVPGGFVGVDMFFVISGFVVTSSVLETERVGYFSFIARFYARRLLRIVPALAVCLLVTFFAAALFIPEAWLSRANDQTGLYAFVGLSNFVLTSNAGNYFAPTAELNPFTHTWSLGVEEQFYLTFPILFLPWIRSFRNVSRSLFAIATVASLICAFWLTCVDEVQAFYMLWSRFWQLGIGVVLAQSLKMRGHSFVARSPDRRALSIGADIGLVVTIVGLFIARESQAPLPAGLLPVIGTAGVLGCLHGRGGGIATRALTLPIVRYVGRISYSVYLWHWPVFTLMRWTCGLEGLGFQAVAMALTFALGAGSYRFIEQPPRQLGGRVPRLAAIGAGLAMVAVGYGLASGIVAWRPALSLSTVMQSKDDWYPNEAGPLPPMRGCTLAGIARGLAVGSMVSYSRTGCAEPVAERSLFVIGDSHAGAYWDMLQHFALETGVTVNLYFNGGCPAFSLLPWSNVSDGCSVYTSAALADVQSHLHPGDVLFLPSLRMPRLVEQWELFDEQARVASVTDPAGQGGRDEAARTALAQLSGITRLGGWVVFEGPPPVMHTIPMRCSDWFNRANPVCQRGPTISRAMLEQMRVPVLRSYQEMVQAVPGITVWDPFPILCPGDLCSAYRDGKSLYFDGDHLSGYANTLLLPYFAHFIEALKGRPPS